MEAGLVRTIGLVAGVALPLWNIPLIVRIGRRKSSADISVTWAVGVLVCIVLMLPAALVSSDPVFKVFSVVNAVLFSGVVVQVVRFRGRA